MNIFEQYGIKEVADVTLYAIELDENDDEIYIPVLYMDTLKVSTVEESTSQTSAQGGPGNPKLITWDYGRDITVNLDDALFTPASLGMNWGGKLNAKSLELKLCHFYDRNTDINTPDTCLRTATLIVDKFSDFLIIPDRQPPYSKKDSVDECPEAWGGNYYTDKIGYVGGTSIYCWMVSGYIISDDDKKRIEVKDLLLFYREQKQKWYFFNGQGIKQESSEDYPWYKHKYEDGDTQDDFEKKDFAINYQYGHEVFNWIKDNICSSEKNWYEYEPVSQVTWENEDLETILEAISNVLGETVTIDNVEQYLDKINENKDEIDEELEELSGPYFLTQKLYIDGYRPDCARSKKYGDILEKEFQVEFDAFTEEKYFPYRYFGSIDVEYNTNVVPPQDVIYGIDTAFNDVRLFEKMEKCQATCTFCIDTDINIKHNQYKNLVEYSQTELTVYYNPATMMPYQPNAFEFYRQNGQRIYGNLRIIKKGEFYLRWTRTRAKQHNALGKQIIIDPIHYPGVYRLVGETYKRDGLGIDKHFQFEIPLCKMHPTNKLTLQADGDPTVFSMKLTALRRRDGVMMKLTEYETTNEEYRGHKSDSEKIIPFVSPNPKLDPEPYDGFDEFKSFRVNIDALDRYDTARTAAGIVEETDALEGGFKLDLTRSEDDTAEQISRVLSKVEGVVGIIVRSIDGTIKKNVEQTFVAENVIMDNATIRGGGAL